MMRKIIDGKRISNEMKEELKEEVAKTREKELREEYKDTDALSIVSFSL